MRPPIAVNVGRGDPVIRADGQFVVDLLNEVKSARAMFPGNADMLAALHEESGEVAKALLDHKRGLRSADEVYCEAVQVAAMALRLALEGDSSFPYRLLDATV